MANKKSKDVTKAEVTAKKRGLVSRQSVEERKDIMRVYCVLVDSNEDEEIEAYILDNICYANEADACKHALKEAKRVKGAWDEGGYNFEIGTYSNGKIVSLSSDDHPNSMHLKVISLEVK